MKNNKIYDLIVIGGGSTGLSATFLAAYQKLNVLCLELTDEIGGQLTKLYPNKLIHDYPGYIEIRSIDLIKNLHEQIKKYSQFAELKTSVDITKFITHNDELIELIDKHNNSYFTKYVLLCVGAGIFDHIKLENFPNSHNHKKIKYFISKTDDFSNKKVIVLGGGDSAIDSAHHIKHNFNSNVSIVHRGDTLRGISFSPEYLEAIGVNVCLNYELEEWTENYCIFVNKQGNKLKIEYDILLIQYGLKNLGTKIHDWTEFEIKNKKFIVNENLETCIKNFYCAGDCIFNINRINMIITGIGEATKVINYIKRNIK